MFVKPRHRNDNQRTTTTPLNNTTPNNTTSASSSNSSSSTRLWWPRSLFSPPPSRSVTDSNSSSRHQKKRPRMVLVGTFAAAVAAGAVLVLALVLNAMAQPGKYSTGAQWKETFLAKGDDRTSWFGRWNSMVQTRIDELAAIAESETERSNNARPFRVTMVGDSTMMQQHGVICAFLGERSGRRFDPEEHQEECCVDTLPRKQQNAGGGEVRGENTNHDNNTPTFAIGNPSVADGGGGRGLCFRHAYQFYAEPVEWESLGSPDAVYFGSGLHLLHMARPGHGLVAVSVQGWLNYERDLENAVETYRAEGGDGFRLVFATTHTIEDSVYEGDFLKVVQGYRDNNAEVISKCESQVDRAAEGATGPEGYSLDTYCRQGLLDRNGSNILNIRSRSVMAKLGVPLVEGDLIVKDQAWATLPTDGRHYQWLVPVEVWDLLGVLVSPFAAEPALGGA